MKTFRFTRADDDTVIEIVAQSFEEAFSKLCDLFENSRADEWGVDA